MPYIGADYPFREALSVMTEKKNRQFNMFKETLGNLTKNAGEVAVENYKFKRALLEEQLKAEKQKETDMRKFAAGIIEGKIQKGQDYYPTGAGQPAGMPEFKRMVGGEDIAGEWRSKQEPVTPVPANLQPYEWKEGQITYRRPEQESTAVGTRKEDPRLTGLMQLAQKHWNAYKEAVDNKDEIGVDLEKKNYDTAISMYTKLWNRLHPDSPLDEYEIKETIKKKGFMGIDWLSQDEITREVVPRGKTGIKKEQLNLPGLIIR